MAATSTTTAITISQSDGHSDDGPSVETLGHQARKDRKRVTDRIAQREHRRRQKVYVEELEAQVKLLKQQSLADQAGGALLLENEKLRAEIKELKTFYSAVESLVDGQKKTPGESEGNISVPEPQSSARLTEIKSPRTSQISREGPYEQNTEEHRAIAISNSMAGRFIGITQENAAHEQVYCPDPTTTVLPQAHETRGGNFSAPNDWWGLISHETSGLDQINCTGTETPTWLNNFFAIGYQSPSGDFNDLGNPGPLDTSGAQHVFSNSFSQQLSKSDVDIQMMNGNHAESDQWNLPGEHFSIEETSPKEISSLQSVDKNSTAGSPDSSRTKFEVQIHRSLSHVLMPPLPEDIYVHEIIERARSNALSQRMLLDAPTLADFLVDNTNNVLSSDLKKYLEPVRRKRRTVEYLGTYWVSYLLLRWQVNQSEESFARLPSWFRPTDLQMHVPHPIAIDFVAWPRLRDELVKLSQSGSDKVHEVLTMIGVYLELNLQSTTTESLTNEQVLNSAVCDLRNWKLGSGFFAMYPQWANVCDSIVSTDMM